MNNDELSALLKSQLASSTGGDLDSDIQDDQRKALDYYNGDPYGNEEAGCSSVVTREVLETIEWMMPSLLKVFIGGERVVDFNPVGPEDEEAAQQETDMVNNIILQENEGYLVFHDWFKDALLQKNGYVKVYWDEEEEVTTEIYENLDDYGLEALDAREDAEIIEHTERVEFEEVQTPMGVIEQPVSYHDVKIEITNKSGRVKIENIPPEEMRIAKTARSLTLDKVPFISHDTILTATDLLELGIEQNVIDKLPSYNENENDLDNYRSLTQGGDSDDNNPVDDSMREIQVHECYVWIDFDDDGKAEYRRVLMSGGEILQNDIYDYCPVASLTPIRMPHKHTGMSEADLVMDLQFIKSTLLRQMLDNLYLTNNPEKEVVEEKVNMDDLMESLPGGIKRVEAMGSIREITVPFTAGASVPMLDILDKMKEARTGISAHTMGLDANALAQSTKGAFMGALEQANQRIEAVARLFAETGVKSVFRKVHALVRKHQDKNKTIKLRNQWVPVNPSEWKERKDLTVSVGLGTANKDALMQRLLSIAEKQEQHLMQGSPIVTPTNVYNTYQKLIEAADMGDANLYFTDPSTIPPKEPQPDPNAQMVQVQAQIAQQQLQLQQNAQQFDQQIKMMEQQRKDAELEHKKFMDQMKEATARADLELKHSVDIPGAAI